MKYILPVVAASLLAFGLTACSQSPTCESVADHVLAIAKADMAKMLEQLPEEQRKQMEEQMNKEFTKDKLIEECKKENPSAESLKCALAAKSMEDMAKCDMSGGEKGGEAAGGEDKPAAEGEAK